MATIKSYTNIEQSKNLARILLKESADMYYHYNTSVVKNYHEDIPNVVQLDNHFAFFNDDIPCWSLTALLRFLPFHIISKNERYGFDMGKGLDKNGETYMIRYNIFSTDICLYKTDYYNNPVDAAYEMILKLHESNLL